MSLGYSIEGKGTETAVSAMGSWPSCAVPRERAKRGLSSGLPHQLPLDNFRVENVPPTTRPRTEFVRPAGFPQKSISE